MKLIWDDFLNLASIVTNLYESICDFYEEEFTIQQKHRRVADTANEYRNFFKDSKYFEFIKIVRIRLKYILSHAIFKL